MRETFASMAEGQKASSSGVKLLGRLAMGAIALVAAGCSDAAPARKASGPSSAKSAAAAYSVAGTTTGMSASQIALDLGRAGYSLVSTDAGSDWALEQKMASTGDKFAIGEPRRGIRAQVFKKGGVRVSIDYLPMPNGPVAYLITYNAPAAVLTFSKAIDELTRRHGQSRFSNNQASAPWAMWCKGSARSARECLDVPHLSVGHDPDGVTIYTEDPSLKQVQRQLLAKSGGQRPTF